jgi:two-component system response regulator YcbB
MRFFIVDDDEAICCMLTEIIEDYDLGEVVGQANDGSVISGELLALKKVDILIIDLLMPVRDGIETIHSLNSSFKGKIIMLSQVEDKGIIGKAYSFGVEHYITKPINRLEVMKIIEKVTQYIKLQESISNIRAALFSIDFEKDIMSKESLSKEKDIIDAGRFFLTELGIISETGSNDLLTIMEYIGEYEEVNSLNSSFPALRDIFTQIAVKKLGPSVEVSVLKKEIKSSEQRVRRTIAKALNYLASLGLVDYSSSKFDEYAANFFDFLEVRKKMLELKESKSDYVCHTGVNMRKFIKTLYIESKKRL